MSFLEVFLHGMEASNPASNLEEPIPATKEESNILYVPPETDKALSEVLGNDSVSFDQGSAPESYAQFDESIKVHCCICGAMIDPNPSNTCMVCLSKSVDMLEGLSLTKEIHQCRTCERWHGPPWTYCSRESNEMLTMCLKKLKGLSKTMKILDAQLVWTEPHSKRIKLRVTISREVMTNTIMQKTVVITFVERNLQCEQCKKSFTPHLWNAVVQIRQKVVHKRTFMFLEQLIIKHNAHRHCINVEEKDDGINFYFKEKAHASELMNFVQNQCVVKIKQSAKLISHNEKTGNVNSKFTIMIDIAPVCKDDLVLLPGKLSRECGGIGPLVLCYKISKSINIVDVVTMETFEIDSATYWKNPFGALLDRRALTPFVVINLDTVNFDVNESRAAKRNKFKFAEAEVQRESDIGVSDQTYFTYTHLGDMIDFNDTVLAYDLESANLPEDQLKDLNKSKKQPPDVVLVRKSYAKTRAKHKDKKRQWKLKHLTTTKKEDDEYLDDVKSKAQKPGKKATKMKQKVKKEEKAIENKNLDYEAFLQDLEEDADMRAQVNFYQEAESKALEDKIEELKIEDEEDIAIKADEDSD